MYIYMNIYLSVLIYYLCVYVCMYVGTYLLICIKYLWMMNTKQTTLGASGENWMAGVQDGRGHFIVCFVLFF